jgi:hypothetical protein
VETALNIPFTTMLYRVLEPPFCQCSIDNNTPAASVYILQQENRVRHYRRGCKRIEKHPKSGFFEKLQENL